MVKNLKGRVSMSLSNFRKILKNVSWVIPPICIFAFTIFVFLFVNTVTLYTAPDEELTYTYLSPDENTMFISILSPDRSLKLNEMTSDGNLYSAIVFSFGPNEENHYIIDEFLFQELVEYLKNKHNIV